MLFSSEWILRTNVTHLIHWLSDEKKSVCMSFSNCVFSVVQLNWTWINNNDFVEQEHVSIHLDFSYCWHENTHMIRMLFRVIIGDYFYFSVARDQHMTTTTTTTPNHVLSNTQIMPLKLHSFHLLPAGSSSFFHLYAHATVYYACYSWIKGEKRKKNVKKRRLKGSESRKLNQIYWNVIRQYDIMEMVCCLSSLFRL